MSWTAARFAVYLAGFAASVLAAMGLADFDIATGNFDLAAFNVYEVAGVASGALTSALAAIAVWRGWGPK